MIIHSPFVGHSSYYCWASGTSTARSRGSPSADVRGPYDIIHYMIYYIIVHYTIL